MTAIERVKETLLMVVLVSAISLLGESLPPFAASCLAEVPEVGPTKESCGGGPCRDASGGGSSSWAPVGLSPEELREQREAEDLGEAALDVNDRGVEAYAQGDYATAVQYLSEALDYAPDDSEIQHNLDRAREALRQSEAAQQLKSVQHHSQIAAHLGNEAASAEARKGFDTPGVDAGTLDLPVKMDVGGEADPVVLPSQRTLKIRVMEWQREKIKQDVQRLEKKRQALDPQTDAALIARIERQQSEKTREIRRLNLGITEPLRTTAAPASQPAQPAP